MKILNRAPGMVGSFFFYVYGLRRFWGIKSAKVNVDAFFSYVCSPLIPTCATDKVDTKKTRLISLFQLCEILGINAAVYVSEIVKAVIGFVAVNMIDAKHRPLSSDVEPSNSVQAVLSVIKPRSQISASGINTAASYVQTSGFEFSLKESRLRVVLKKFAYTLCGKINLSHAVVPLKQWFGQKPRSVSALAGLRHFNIQRRILL